MVLTRQNMEKYANIEREINRIERKLDYYTKNPIASVHGVVKGSMKNYPYAEKHFVISGSDVKTTDERDKKIKNLVIMLQNKRKEYEDFELEIDIAIEEIEDMEIRQILEMKYIEKMKDYDIAEELGYERSTISKKIDRFFDSQEHSHNSHSNYDTVIV